jgi:hypothetical protein
VEKNYGAFVRQVKQTIRLLEGCHGDRLVAAEMDYPGIKNTIFVLGVSLGSTVLLCVGLGLLNKRFNCKFTH